MGEYPDYIFKGGYPKDPDLPDHIESLYTSTKNTWQDAENLDDTHGYDSYIWIPEETFAVKIMKLHVYAEKFRAYSKSALAGGGSVATSTVTTVDHTHDVTIPNHTHDVAIGTKTSTSEATHRHPITTQPAVGTIVEDSYISLQALDNTVVALVNVKLMGAKDIWTYGAPQAHDHDVVVGTVTSAAGGGTTVTSASGGGSHSHDVTIPAHTHDIEYGIYEEDVAVRTLSAILYNPDGDVVHDFGIITTGEDDEEIDLSSYFATLQYGMYRLALTASDRLRARLVFYELCVMYNV